MKVEGKTDNEWLDFQTVPRGRYLMMIDGGIEKDERTAKASGEQYQQYVLKLKVHEGQESAGVSLRYFSGSMAQDFNRNRLADIIACAGLLDEFQKLPDAVQGDKNEGYTTEAFATLLCARLPGKFVSFEVTERPYKAKDGTEKKGNDLKNPRPAAEHGQIAQQQAQPQGPPVAQAQPAQGQTNPQAGGW